MKLKVSDYIVEYFNKNNINVVFSITGGFAMHLNDSFGNNKNCKIYYQHHEQACGYSALGYSKTNSNPTIVCTTAGCAATNAITPCLVAYQDSLPVLFISGQSKSIELTRYLNNENMKLRHYSGQDCDIISMVTPITKYAHELMNIEELPGVLDNCVYNLINDRPGPVWLSVPIDIQGQFMEYVEINVVEKINLPYTFVNDLVIIDKYLKECSRPVIIAGNGIKIGKCKNKFKNFLKKYNTPVVVTWHGTDAIETDDKLFSGKIGLLGDRLGNFVLQNSDLIISLGCRMSQTIVGYNPDTFAREAKIVYIDIDKNEIQKTNVKYSYKCNMDLATFFDNFNFESKNYDHWINKCNYWKNKWIFEMPENYLDDSHGINPYYALKVFYNLAPSNKNTICASGSIVTNIWHMVKIKENDDYIISSQGDMGFEITAAIGSQIAEPTKLIIPIFGEGSLQLNIQELQTIVHHKLPIKMLIFNNNSYGANVITQKLYFKNYYGSNPDTGVSFPNTEKISKAYGIKYMSILKNEDLEKNFTDFLNSNEAIICEVFCCIQQRTPKLSSVKNSDGSFSSRPFEDMEPFMSREDFEKEMIVEKI